MIMADGAVLSEVVIAAFRLAASERPPGFPLATGRVLAALSRVDMANDWQRISLYTSDPLRTGLAEALDDPYRTDPASPAVGWADGIRELNSLPTWEGAPMSERLAAALALVGRICDACRLGPAPSGAMTLALVADSENGAARVLLGSGSITHGKLLDLIQADLLGTHLEGLDRLLVSARPRLGAPVAGAPAALSTPESPAVQSIPKSPATPGIPTASSVAPTAVAANLAAAARGVGNFPWLRFPRRRWRLVSVACVSLIGVGLFWHRQFLPPPTPLVLPPYAVPAVAHQVLATADLPNVGDGGWLPMQDGPPLDGIFTGTGRFRADGRRLEFVGAWQRGWVSTNGQNEFTAKAFEITTRGLAQTWLSTQCAPSQGAALPGTVTAGYVFRQQGAAKACAVALRGRTVVAITVWSKGAAASTVAWDAVRAGMRSQLPRVPVTARDLPIPWGDMNDLRTAINSALMGIVLGVPILLGLGTVLRDRSTWRRLRSGFAFYRSRQSFSVDPLVNARLARHGGLTLVRLAVLTWTMRMTEEWHRGLWQSGAALTAAIAAMLATEWLVRRRSPAPWRPAVFSGGRSAVGAVSLVLSAAIGGAGIFLALVGAMFLAFGTGLDGTDLLVTQVGHVLPVAGVILIFVALVPFTLARRLGMRALRNQARQQRSPDEERHPVLLLRSFADDRRVLRARRLDRASIVERLCMRRFERFEEVSASALAVYGPILALSQVGEKLPPPLGAERRSFSMDDWKERIRELIGAARLICVTVGRSQSLLWEIEQIRDAGVLTRAIFVLPPTGQTEQRRRLAVLTQALGVDFARLDQTWPGSDVLAVVFPDGTNPVVITCRAQNDVGYEAAIGAWAIAITGDTRSFPADLRRLSGMLAAYAASDQAPEADWASLPKRSAPQPVVYAPGKAPVYKPWSRRMVSWRVLPWMLSVVIIPTVGKLAFGHTFPAATVQASYSVSSLVSAPGSSAVYAVLARHIIQQLDFDPGHADAYDARTAHVTDEIDELVISGTDGYYTSQPGHVGRVDLATGRTAWTRPMPVGVRSPVLADGRVIITSPATGEVIELSAADGHILERRTLPGTPYGVTGSRGRLYVTLARADKVAELDPAALATVGTFRVPAGPRDIFADGKRVWVLCLLAHKLVSLGPGQQPTLTLSDQSPGISSLGGWLAIEGQEWVSVLSPADIVTRIPLTPPDISALVAQPDGSVVVGYRSGEIDKLR
jgi:hypothetical protein